MPAPLAPLALLAGLALTAAGLGLVTQGSPSPISAAAARRPVAASSTDPAASARPLSRPLSWPLRSPASPAAVRRGFGVGPLPWSPGHRGVDLAAAPGEVVLAAADGVVRFAGSVAGVASVSVDHPDGLRTTYQPVLAQVRAGQRVARGYPLGVLGGWPAHCAGCLHWGALLEGEYVDPLGLLRRGPAVLLPVPDAAG